MPGDYIEDPTKPWSPNNPFGYPSGATPPASDSGQAPSPERPAAGTSVPPQQRPAPTQTHSIPPTVRVDEHAATQSYTAGQNGLQEHRDAIPDHDPAGLDDPVIAEALQQHNKKTKDRFTEAHRDLADGKGAAAALGEENRRGTQQINRAADPGAVSAFRAAMSQPAPAASPFAAPAMPAQTPPVQPMPLPMQAPPPQPVSLPMQPPPPLQQLPPPAAPLPPTQQALNANALAKLINPAKDVAPVKHSAVSSPSRARTARTRIPGGSQAPLAHNNQVAIQPTGKGTLTRSQLHSFIEQALDNNGITKDRRIREIWHDLCYRQYMKESAGVVDAVNRDDINARGATIPTDNAPSGSSRGVGQVIPETFARYHVAGTSNNIYDPEANLSASVNYMMHRYRVAADGTGLIEFYQQRVRNGFGGY